jgi:hypothetical protein
MSSLVNFLLVLLCATSIDAQPIRNVVKAGAVFALSGTNAFTSNPRSAFSVVKPSSDAARPMAQVYAKSNDDDDMITETGKSEDEYLDILGPGPFKFGGQVGRKRRWMRNLWEKTRRQMKSAEKKVEKQSLEENGPIFSLGGFE